MSFVALRVMAASHISCRFASVGTIRPLLVPGLLPNFGCSPLAHKFFPARTFAIGDKLKSKESVEENKFMREQEKAFFEKRKAALKASEHEEFKATIAPWMAEVQALLKKSGDSVSDEGLEALAKWKLELKDK